MKITQVDVDIDDITLHISCCNDIFAYCNQQWFIADDTDIQKHKYYEGNVTRYYYGHKQSIEFIQISIDGTIMVSRDWYGGANIWNVKSGQSNKLDDIGCITISPCGSFLACVPVHKYSYRQYISVYRVNYNFEIELLREYTDFMYFEDGDDRNSIDGIAITSKFIFINTSYYGLYKIDRDTGKSVQLGGYKQSIMLSPNGCYLVTSDKKAGINIYCVQTDELVKSVECQADSIRDIEISTKIE
jgi:WD40 repeat protein